MNFEEAYNNFMNGTASDEEAQLVREEIRKAREISALLDRAPAEDVFNTAEAETIKKARKSFNLKTTIRIIVVVLLVLVIIAAGICGYIFGTAIPAARRNATLSEQQSLEAATVYLSEYLGEDASKFEIRDIDRHLHTDNGLKNTVYHYEIEFRNARAEYEVTVNASSGYCMLTDIDNH